MSFLQPALLFGLPLVMLPVVIHLINRQRHRTVQWGAMMFLLDAKRMTRGMAKLRQFLILALRVLAVAGLIFALSRPLAGGWLGGAAGGADSTTLILLDRSASMEQQDLQAGQSKRATALAKVAEAWDKVGGNRRLVLIDSAGLRPVEVDSPAALTTLPETAATATSADVPALLGAALDYVEANRSGRADIWLCTDLRENDWDAGSGRWESVRARASALDGVRLFLLNFPATARDNLSVQVTKVARRTTGGQSELVIDAVIRREAEDLSPVRVPLEFVVGGARSTHTVEVEDREFVLQGHTIPIDSKLEQGWGRVALPADSNPVDNAFHFVFAEPAPQRTVVVAEDFAFAEAVALAARVPSEQGLQYEVETRARDEAGQIDWESTALVVWQGEIPDGLVAQQLQNFVDAGKSLLFFPPNSPAGGEIFGHRWSDWDNDASSAQRVESWRTDVGLLQNTLAGDALPVGEMKIFRHCPPVGDGTVVARLGDGSPLLMRATTDRGKVWFCGTFPTASHSSMARDGVAFYVMLHRAIASGARALGRAKMLETGEGTLPRGVAWSPLGDGSAIAAERAFNSGAFGDADGGRLVALNRPGDEDAARVLDPAKVDSLLEGVDYKRIDDEAGSLKSLASEIWRVFLFLLGAALIAEAVLCLPEKRRVEGREAEGK